MSCSRTQRCSTVEAWNHGHSVSSQALYHDSKSQFLNPKNKLLYEMKKIQLLFFRNNVFIYNFGKMCLQ